MGMNDSSNLDELDDDDLDDQLNQPESNEDYEDDEDHDDDSHSSSTEDEDDESSIKSQEEESSEDSEDEAEKRRELNRQRRHEKKQRAREREENLRRELQVRDTLISQLTSRLNTIERKSQGVDIAQVDSAIKQLDSAYMQAQQQLKEATENQDGTAAVQANELMFRVRQRFEHLTRIKQALEQQARKPPPLDPQIVVHANRWMGQNNWYKPEGADRDSRLVRRIDQELADEGRVPTDPGYWSELTNRVKKELPHRFQQAHNTSTDGGTKKEVAKRRQPVGSSGSSEQRSMSNSGSKVGTLSKERVAALKEAGLWDDPKIREKAIREFQDFDKQQARS